LIQNQNSDKDNNPINQFKSNEYLYETPIDVENSYRSNMHSVFGNRVVKNDNFKPINEKIGARQD